MKNNDLTTTQTSAGTLHYAPIVTLHRASAEDLSWLSMALLALLISATTAISAHAQTYSVLFRFAGGNGSGPSALVQGFDGDLYGVTAAGGVTGKNSGTIFKISPTGTFTTLYTFCAQTGCPDGAYPGAALVLGTDGNFYGTTSSGGAHNVGTVFKVTPDGTLTTLYSFCTAPSCSEGDRPNGSLILGTDGNFYGTTQFDGGSAHKGGVFKITPSGTLTAVYTFCQIRSCPDGGQPLAGLIQASDGNFYGTTTKGSLPTRYGTIFRLTPSGVEKTMYRFSGTDGEFPAAPLVQGRDGNFYGTTEFGGANGHGTAFKITPTGVLTTLYDFCAQSGCADGSDPVAGLIQPADGNFYGTTTGAGGTGMGTVFKISAGTLSTLHSFTGGDDGAFPWTELLQGTDGNLYGTTSGDGVSNFGTIYIMGVGLGPIVNSVPTSGTVGTSVTILGTNLTGASKVAFNGVAAAFTVVSSSEITTTVPTGATTGKIKVMTPNGTLSTNFKFRVLP